MIEPEEQNMAQAQTYEGTPSQLAEQLLTLPGSQKYRMTLISEEPVEEGAESLEAAITRMTNRTPGRDCCCS